MLLVADARIEARRDHVDEGVVGLDLEDDAGMRGEEGDRDPRQDVARHHGRRADPQGPARAVAKPVHRVDRLRDLADQWPEPVEEVAAGLRGRQAAGGAVEEAHPEPGLEPAQGLAEARGRDAPQARRPPDASGPGHRHEGVEVAEIGIGHRAEIRTPRA